MGKLSLNIQKTLVEQKDSSGEAVEAGRRPLSGRFFKNVGVRRSWIKKLIGRIESDTDQQRKHDFLCDAQKVVAFIVYCLASKEQPYRLIETVLFEYGKIDLFTDGALILNLLRLFHGNSNFDAMSFYRKILVEYKKMNFLTGDQFWIQLLEIILPQGASVKALISEILFDHRKIFEINCAESLLFECDIINYIDDPVFVIDLIARMPSRTKEILFEREKFRLFSTKKLLGEGVAMEGVYSLQRRLLAVFKPDDEREVELLRKIIEFIGAQDFADVMSFLEKNLDFVDFFIRCRPDLISNGAELVEFSKLGGFPFRARFVLYDLNKIEYIEDLTQLETIGFGMRPKEKKVLYDDWFCDEVRRIEQELGEMDLRCGL